MSAPSRSPAAAGDAQVIDTHLTGEVGLMSCYLLSAERPAIVDPGAQTSAARLIEELAAAGVGPSDLAWIVLTHIHLDHCGGTGTLVRAYPRARVVVHRRGARHLPEPERLVRASHAVYGERAQLYGGLEPVPEERIDVAPDGHRVDLGGGRALTMIEAPGHARHQMAVFDETTGVLFPGDAVGVRLPGAGLYPTVPPADIDVEAALATLERLAERAPTAIGLGHFGFVPEPAGEIERSREQWTRAGEAARAGWRREGTVAAVDQALRAALPPERCIGEPSALATLTRVGWIADNADGMAAWAAAQEGPPEP